jgi:hypothetical protein
VDSAGRKPGAHYNAEAAALAHGRTSEFLHQQLRGDLRSFQPVRTTGAPSASTALFAALKSAVEKGLSKAGLMLLCSSGKARLLVKRFEMTRKIEIERFSLTTSKQFDEVIAGVNAAIGHQDMAEFGDQLTKRALLPS